MKQYILIRRDIIKKYSLGKVIAHACHNSMTAALMDFVRTKEWIDNHDQTKIVVWIANEEALWGFLTGFAHYKHEIPYCWVYDKKLAIPFCGAVGPVTDEEAEELGLKEFKLVKSL